MTSKLGDSRVSWTSALYAIPSRRSREPLIGPALSLRASATFWTTYDRHARVDLVRGLDELRRVAVLAEPRREEVRHDRDAVAAEAGPG